MKYYTKAEIKERVSCIKRGHFSTSLPNIKTRHMTSSKSKMTRFECEQKYFFYANNMKDVVDGLFYFLNSER